MRFARTLVLLALAACASPEIGTRPVDSPLIGTRWSLVSTGGSPVLASESTSMQFDRTQLSGSDGCNRYTTSYSTNESRMKIGPLIAGTRMACPAPIMEEATTFISILGHTAGYRRDGDRMTLLDGSGRPMAEFRKIEP